MEIILSVHYLFYLKVRSVFSGKTALWFQEAPKSLNFLSQCNVKKNACMEARERYIKSKVNGEYNVHQF